MKGFVQWLFDMICFIFVVTMCWWIGINVITKMPFYAQIALAILTGFIMLALLIRDVWRK